MTKKKTRWKLAPAYFAGEAGGVEAPGSRGPQRQAVPRRAGAGGRRRGGPRDLQASHRPARTVHRRERGHVLCVFLCLRWCHFLLPPPYRLSYSPLEDFYIACPSGRRVDDVVLDGIYVRTSCGATHARARARISPDVSAFVGCWRRSAVCALSVRPALSSFSPLLLLPLHPKLFVAVACCAVKLLVVVVVVVVVVVLLSERGVGLPPGCSSACLMEGPSRPCIAVPFVRLSFLLVGAFLPWV